MIEGELEGDEKLARRLLALERKDAGRIARKALGKGLTQIAKGIRQQAPTAVKPEARRRLKKSVGTRNKRNRIKGVREAKAGLNVGKKRGSAARMPHAHLIALGTRPRHRKRIGGAARPRSRASRHFAENTSTGTMPALAKEMVPGGARAASGNAAAAIRQAVATEIEKLGP